MIRAPTNTPALPGGLPFDATQLSFSQSPVASAGTVSAKLQQIISVKDAPFNALGDGVTDDTAAFQAANDAVVAAQNYLNTTGLAGRERASIGAIIVPRGKYRKDGVVNMGRFVNIISEDGAYISQAAGTTAFSWANCYVNKVQGLSINGGSVGLYFENANVDATRVEIDNCDFQLTTDYAIKTIGTGATQISGNLRINDNCRFFGCNKILYNSFDEARFGGWVEIDTVVGSDNPMTANSALFYNAFGHLRFDRMMGVPNVGTDGSRKANIRWIDNHGLSIYAINSRFGGESAGMPIVYNFAAPDASTWIGPQVIFKNSDLYCGLAAQTDNGVVVLGSGGFIPAHITVEDCNGPSTGFWVNNKVAGTNLATYISGQIAAQPNLTFVYKFFPNMSPGMTVLSTTAGTANDLDPYTILGRDVPWRAPTLLNSWANVGAPHNNAGFLLDSDGFVHMRGLLNTGVIPNPICTLPVGYRPANTENLVTAPTTAAVPAWIQITAAGSVIPQSGTAASGLSLDGIIFRALKV